MRNEKGGWTNVTRQLLLSKGGGRFRLRVNSKEERKEGRWKKSGRLGVTEKRRLKTSALGLFLGGRKDAGKINIHIP